MALPTTNLTSRFESDTGHVFKEYTAGNNASSGTPADGDLVEAWDDEGM